MSVEKQRITLDIAAGEKYAYLPNYGLLEYVKLNDSAAECEFEFPKFGLLEDSIPIIIEDFNPGLHIQVKYLHKVNVTIIVQAVNDRQLRIYKFYRDGQGNYKIDQSMVTSETDIVNPGGERNPLVFYDKYPPGPFNDTIFTFASIDDDNTDFDTTVTTFECLIDTLSCKVKASINRRTAGLVGGTDKSKPDDWSDVLMIHFQKQFLLYSTKRCTVFIEHQGHELRINKTMGHVGFDDVKKIINFRGIIVAVKDYTIHQLFELRDVWIVREVPMTELTGDGQLVFGNVYSTENHLILDVESREDSNDQFSKKLIASPEYNPKRNVTYDNKYDFSNTISDFKQNYLLDNQDVSFQYPFFNYFDKLIVGTVKSQCVIVNNNKQIDVKDPLFNDTRFFTYLSMNFTETPSEAKTIIFQLIIPFGQNPSEDLYYLIVTESEGVRRTQLKKLYIENPVLDCSRVGDPALLSSNMAVRLGFVEQEHRVREVEVAVQFVSKGKPSSAKYLSYGLLGLLGVGLIAFLLYCILKFREASVKEHYLEQVEEEADMPPLVVLEPSIHS